MLLSFKKTLLGLVSVGLLAGCSGGTDESTSPGVYVLSSMSPVQEGYQTFQPRDFIFDNSDVDDNESTYVYQNRADDTLKNVSFYISNDSGTETEELIVSSANDINDTYSSFSIDDATIRVDGKVYTDDFVLIQDKSTGELYPVVEKNDGVWYGLNHGELSESVYWMDSYHYSNIADMERIYLNNTEDEELNIFEFDGNYFVYQDTLDYAGNDFWIDASGNILMQETANALQFYFYAQGEYDDPLSKQETLTFFPFLYAGDIYATRANNSNVYELKTQSSTFYMSYTSSWSNDDESQPAINTVYRDNYWMTSGCELYQINDDSASEISINYDRDFSDEGVDNVVQVVAGQSALFCVYQDSDDMGILRYDLETAAVTTYAVSDVNATEVINYFTVLSDTEVMFSETPTDSFNEYYVDLDATTTDILEVTESSVALLQRLSN